MSCTVNVDWKFVVALGVAPSCVILVRKISPEAAERVFTQACEVLTSALKVQC